MKKYLFSLLMALIVFAHINSAFAASYSDEWKSLTEESSMVTKTIKDYTPYHTNTFNNLQALAQSYLGKGKLYPVDSMVAATVNHQLYFGLKYDMKKQKLAQTYYEASNSYLKQYAQSKGISVLTAQRNLLYNLSRLNDHPEVVGNVMDFMTNSLPNDPVMFTIYLGHRFNYKLPVNPYKVANARKQFPNIGDFVFFEAIFDKDLDESVFDDLAKFDWNSYQFIRPGREFFDALDYQIDAANKAREEARKRAEAKARYEEFLRNHAHNWQTRYWCNNHGKYIDNYYCSDILTYEYDQVITCDMRPSVKKIYRCTICGAVD